MKRILVPTDFSEHANYATEVAAQIAKKHNAELFLLHILDIETYGGTGGQSVQDIPEGLFLLKLAQKRFDKLLKEPYLKGVKIVDAIQFETTYKNITSQAEKHKIDLIVMGTHGVSGLKEVFVGSNTEKVVRIAQCPVLSVKQRHTDFSMKDVVFASNFKEEAYEAFPKFKELVAMFKARVHLLCVSSPGHFHTTFQAEQDMQEFANCFELENYTINLYNEKDIETGVLRFSEAIMADVIAVSTHGRSGISAILNASIANSLVNHADRPVLSMKVEEKG
ncbi:MAG: nucleotide-binding universal stress UspA family protein [Flavobacteriales bacterium]|jgi:nucleotide-binding universal stress UspA family protein